MKTQFFKFHLFLKNVLDFLGSFIILILISPILVLISLSIFIEDKGIPFFLQKRIGKNQKIFKIIKFRTMILNAENMGSGVFTNEKDNRITKVGKILRKYSLDELPQLFNILKGEMSFIGPRPPVVYFPYKINEYPIEYEERFDIKPGITGLAQISGRTNLKWEERFIYDIRYKNNYSLVLDMKIILKTLAKVFASERVYPTDEFIKENHNLKK
jgi:lipopolysaccharide/colanic/teichoic acid biosynthesis glycosyltransferase